jgi:hypothetical protein
MSKRLSTEISTELHDAMTSIRLAYDMKLKEVLTEALNMWVAEYKTPIERTCLFEPKEDTEDVPARYTTYTAPETHTDTVRELNRLLEGMSS